MFSCICIVQNRQIYGEICGFRGLRRGKDEAWLLIDVSFGANKDVLKLDCGEGCAALNIPKNC